MRVEICESKQAMGERAAEEGARLIREALLQRGEANIVVASGTSQLEMLGNLVAAEGIAWHDVTGFHLDEYVGLPITHPASFRLYMWQRFVKNLPLPLRRFVYIEADRDPERERRRLSALLKKRPIDVAFVGIGENGHLAFNEPPADFQTEEPYLIIELTEASRRQQVGEGWFSSIDQVPQRAISMSVRQIMSARSIVCTVPDRRKAVAVAATVEGPVTPEVPASILQRHDHATLYLDPDSASLLGGGTKAAPSLRKIA